MKSAISNIAWPATANDDALALAVSLGFSGIEIAPMRIFGSLGAINLGDVKSYRVKLVDYGLEVAALQGILFGVDGVHLFRDAEQRSRLREALLRIADIAVALEAKACVFGAPTVRDPGQLSARAATDLIVPFFREVGSQFAARSIVLCFEPNPPLYNCRFVTTTREAFDFVNEIASPGIRLQLDIGTILINVEEAGVVQEVSALVGHCHLSEPHLQPVGSQHHDHRNLAAALNNSCYKGWISAEMRETSAWQQNMVRAARMLRDIYGLPMT